MLYVSRSCRGDVELTQQMSATSCPFALRGTNSTPGGTLTMYCGVRVEAVTNAAAYRQASHDCRRTVPGYVHVPRATVVTPSGRFRGWTALREDLAMRSARQKDLYRKTHGRRKTGNSKDFQRGIIWAGAEGEAYQVDQEKLKAGMARAVGRIAEEGGVNVVYIAFHDDETSPHCHFLLENFDYRDCRSANRRYRKAFLSRMQDIVAEELQPLGFKRGEPKECSGRRHRTVIEGHRIQQREAETKTQTLLEGVDALRDMSKSLQSRLHQRVSEYMKVLKIKTKNKDLQHRIQAIDNVTRSPYSSDQELQETIIEAQKIARKARSILDSQDIQR